MMEFLIGTLLGALAGIGVGGGSLLILWLTAVNNTEPHIARCINLMFFIIAAGFVSFFRLKKGTIQIKKILPGILAGCICAALFSWIGSKSDPDLMKNLFGGLLLITGLRELFYRPRKAK